jgi:hypothetical protein
MQRAKKKRLPHGRRFRSRGCFLVRFQSRHTRKTPRTEIPRVEERLVAARVARVARSRPVEHVKRYSVGLPYRLTTTCGAIRRDDCEATYKNTESTHSRLQRKRPVAFSRWGDPHRVIEKMASALARRNSTAHAAIAVTCIAGIAGMRGTAGTSLSHCTRHSSAKSVPRTLGR